MVRWNIQPSQHQQQPIHLQQAHINQTTITTDLHYQHNSTPWWRVPPCSTTTAATKCSLKTNIAARCS